ncbi:MAG TPA: dihydroorotate dehydrogenase [Firmicutes bacterium]|jgi:dihydroorotate dehydrogenase (fumarate)|nr:dihydroorotate dehydrogenase [Bacillota bacterium]
MDLKTSFDGLKLNNPLMPAAGPLVGDDEKMMFLEAQGCGAIVSKTISTKDAHIPKPCIYGDREYVMNSELWSEFPKEMWINHFLPDFKRKSDGRPLIISVGYTKEDMEELIPLLDPFADAFEVSTHYVGTDLNVVGETVATIRKHTKKPIYMKISPHIPHPDLFAKTIKEHGANGVVAINSLGPTMKINIKTREIEYGNDKGFVWTSGPVIKNLALATVYTIKQAEPSLTVIGVGGIASADDVIEFLLAGASAVQMLSAALLRGKQLYSNIIADLPKALEKYGFQSVKEVIATNLCNPVKYQANVPELIPEKCIKCDLCVKVCPYFAITMRDQITFDATKCFNCGLCVTKCPTKAIIMK